MTSTSTRRGFSVRVFLPDGDPDGVKIVEKSNWTGCGLVVPRALYSEARSRPELARAGVYLLVGNTEASPLSQLYIGEGDPVQPRLEQHAKLKDFWSSAMLSTGRYSGHPMMVHLQLPIDAVHFHRWLALFEETAYETLTPLHAADILDKAHRIARNFQAGLAYQREVISSAH